MWAWKWFSVTLSWLPTLDEILYVLCTKLWAQSFFFTFPLLLYLFPLVTSGHDSGVWQSVPCWWVYFPYQTSNSFPFFLFQFLSLIFFCACAHTCLSLYFLFKDLSFPSVKNSWHCEEFLPVGAQICYCILGEAVKLHWFSFLLKKEGKVAVDIQMTPIGFFVLI